MDRELKKVLTDGVKVGKRIADALEHIVDEPMVEITPPPPQCPHCGIVNPEIQLDETKAIGKVMEFVLEARCAHCNKPVFGLTDRWFLTGKRTEAIAAGKKMRGES